TMGTAILAMIPIALNTQTVDGMPPYYPMARAIAGGLAVSTVVSLLFLPTIYAIPDDLRTGTARLVRRARGLDTGRAAAGAPGAHLRDPGRPAHRHRAPGAPRTRAGHGRRAPQRAGGRGGVGPAARQRKSPAQAGLSFFRRWRGLQPTSLPSMRRPPVHTPIAVPRLVRKKLSRIRATRLRHQPLSVCTSSRRAMKSA